MLMELAASASVQLSLFRHLKTLLTLMVVALAAGRGGRGGRRHGGHRRRDCPVPAARAFVARNNNCSVITMILNGCPALT